MKWVIRVITFVTAVVIINASCKKEPNEFHPSAPAYAFDKYPVANARTDFAVNYDLQTCTSSPVNLSGAGSNDPDGSLASYEWSGPGRIVNPDSAVTREHDLPPGEYRFVLKVKDGEGVVDDDEVIVNGVETGVLIQSGSKNFNSKN